MVRPQFMVSPQFMVRPNLTLQLLLRPLVMVRMALHRRQSGSTLTPQM
jgi:hypothetical protein